MTMASFRYIVMASLRGAIATRQSNVMAMDCFAMSILSCAEGLAMTDQNNSAPPRLCG